MTMQTKKRSRRWRRLLSIQPHGVCYLSWVETDWNFAFKVVPIALTVAMITTEMPAAISPYSIAVAPDSSLIKAETLDIDVLPLVIEVHVSALPIKETLSGATTRCQVFPDLSKTRLTRSSTIKNAEFISRIWLSPVA